MTDSEGMLPRLRELDSQEFVQIIAESWEERGWQTALPEEEPGDGVDVIASRQFPYEEKVGIKAMNCGQNSDIGGPDIQECASLRYTADVDQVVIVTTGDFTEAAQNRAKELNVKYVNGETLTFFIKDLEAEKITEQAKSDDTRMESSEQNNPATSTSNIHIKVISLLRGHEIPEYSEFSREDLEEELRGVASLIASV